MQILLGIACAKGGDPETPTVTRTAFPVAGEDPEAPDDGATVDFDVDLGVLTRDVLQKVQTGVGRGICAANTAVLPFIEPPLAWSVHSDSPPVWVQCDSHLNPPLAARFQSLLARLIGCADGAPADVEATHRTYNGPPGVGVPETVPESEG